MNNKIAIVQIPPVFMNLTQTIEQSCALIKESKSAGADIVLFPEAYLPGYPAWIWHLRPGTDFVKFNELYQLLIQNSVNLTKNHLNPILSAAKENNITVAIGLNEIGDEASGTTLYNTFIIISKDGTILNVHRKLVPTTAERMIWGRGDASGLNAVDTASGKIGALICWENYMPLSRFALYAQGIELYLAPTWDNGDAWISSMSHIARESGCYVASCSTPYKVSDFSEELPYKKDIFTDNSAWLNNGDAVLIDPFGNVVSGPMRKEYNILYGEYDLSKIYVRRRSLDVAGHYSRPDIFNLEINKSRPMQINTTK